MHKGEKKERNHACKKKCMTINTKNNIFTMEKN